MRPSPSLSLLLAASAALTGHAPARADETGAEQYAGYRFNVYSEDALSASSLGDPRRYQVYSQQFLLNTPIGNRNTLSVNATHEACADHSGSQGSLCHSVTRQSRSAFPSRLTCSTLR